MTWTEFLIIYLAFGSPFAVYRFSQVDTPFSVAHVTALLAAFLAWPVPAARLMAKWLVPQGDGSDGSRDLAIQRIRASIEVAAYPTATTGSLLEFREVFDRYTGLALAIEKGVSAPRELFAISGHSKPDLGTKVLARRDREKLLFHYTQARNEFVDLVAGLSLSGDEVLRLANDLAVTLGDTDAVDDLNALGTPRRSQEATQPISVAASVR